MIIQDLNEKVNTLDHIERFLAGKTKGGKMSNQADKTEIFTLDNIDRITNAITRFAFQNGPVEDMHASPKGRLTQKDMKLLKKTMHNRLAYIFTLIVEDRWTEFKYVIDDFFNSQWDKAVPDSQGYTERLLIHFTKALKAQER